MQALTIKAAKMMAMPRCCISLFFAFSNPVSIPIPTNPEANIVPIPSRVELLLMDNPSEAIAGIAEHASSWSSLVNAG